MIEGFYGPPWSHAERLDLLAFCGREGLNTWVHAPKDDPFHRARWREPYPDAQLARARRARGARPSSTASTSRTRSRPASTSATPTTAELETLVAKCEQVRRVGVASFQLLWDDVEHAQHCPEDERLHGTRPRAAHEPLPARAFLEQRAARRLPDGLRGHRRLAVPTRPSRRRLDAAVVVYWTGPEVVSLAITREELDAATRRFAGHELLLWDNYPVNDWDAETLFLGPLRGRDPRLDGGRCAGSVANAMVQAIPSKLPLATFADWARDPRGYDPVASFERALDAYGAEVLRGAPGARVRGGRAGAPLEEARRRAHRRRRRRDVAGAAGAARVTDVGRLRRTAAGVVAAAAARATRGVDGPARTRGTQSAAWSPAASAGRTSATPP